MANVTIHIPYMDPMGIVIVTTNQPWFQTFQPALLNNPVECLMAFQTPSLLWPISIPTPSTTCSLDFSSLQGLDALANHALPLAANDDYSSFSNKL